MKNMTNDEQNALLRHFDNTIGASIRKNIQAERTCIGTCELCGGRGRELHVLVLLDWIGWACDECREQIMKCYMGQIQAAAGHTEPAE